MDHKYLHLTKPNSLCQCDSEGYCSTVLDLESIHRSVECTLCMNVIQRSPFTAHTEHKPDVLCLQQAESPKPSVRDMSVKTAAALAGSKHDLGYCCRITYFLLSEAQAAERYTDSICQTKPPPCFAVHKPEDSSTSGFLTTLSKVFRTNQIPPPGTRADICGSEPWLHLADAWLVSP